MSTMIHKVKVGNQTKKLLTVVPNQLAPQPIRSGEYVEWDSYPREVSAQVLAKNLRGEVIYLGTFQYSNLHHNYADLHLYKTAVKRESRDYFTLYYYLEGDTIYPSAFVEKSVWDSLREGV